MSQVRVAIVGGRLQGLEATYLCSKAGIRTTLIDNDPNPPAKALSDEFHRIDIVKSPDRTKQVLRKCDAVLPANENREALTVLQRISKEVTIPFMQDNEAFWVTSNKNKAMEFLRKSRIPIPASWPRSGFPVIVKPSNKSGSEGVYRADNAEQLENRLKAVRQLDNNPVVQAFIDGQALSLEVMSSNGVGRPLQVTGLEFDERYGCKRVYAPAKAPSKVEERMRTIGKKVASNLNLNGLTDIQTLIDETMPRVNEINARLPSQTPSVVYHSTGTNMVQLLISLFLEHKPLSLNIHFERAVVYQHVKILGKNLTVRGEHIMVQAPKLRIMKGLLGADEAITNLEPGSDPTNRVATLIVKSHDLAHASKKMEEVVGNIMNEYHLEQYIDPSPTRGHRL
jgi:pyrrolysine biosynthesis protein PylC